MLNNAEASLDHRTTGPMTAEHLESAEDILPEECSIDGLVSTLTEAQERVIRCRAARELRQNAMEVA